MPLVGPEHPKDILTSGESVVVRITGIDPKQQRMSLSLRQATDEAKATWEIQKQENAEAIDDGIIDDFSLLGAAYASQAHESPKE
jgi:ribosomal protein S1